MAGARGITFTVPGIPVGKGPGSPRKATDEQILAAYADAGSISAAAKILGMCGQSVHERLKRLGRSRPVNVLTEADEDRLRSEYPSAAASGQLGALAAEMGRTKQYICRHAKSLGLTNPGRKKPFLSGEKSPLRAWRKANPHPRGMLGKKHRFTKAEWSEIAVKGMRTKLDRHGTIAPRVERGSWKAAWREIGGKRKYYRSRWEANYARYLEWLRARGEIADWSHEPETFWFEKIKRGVRSYLPDFKVTENNGSIAYHEVKGWMDARSRTTINRMRIYHPTVNLIVIDGKQYAAIASKVSGMVEGWE